MVLGCSNSLYRFDNIWGDRQFSNAPASDDGLGGEIVDFVSISNWTEINGIYGMLYVGIQF